MNNPIETSKEGKDKRIMIRVVITGTSRGIGKATALYFLESDPDFEVFGLDTGKSTITHDRYHHIICDVSDASTLPDIEHVNVLINNAGVQDKGFRDIEVNLIGVINCTNKYGLQQYICSIVNQSSVSAHNGAEFPNYVASKGGVLAYTKCIAKQIGEEFGATCNSISFGGVSTELNEPVMVNKEAWDEIMSMTPLKKWVTPFEAAEWIYFIAMKNRSMTAQDIIIDNGEMYNHRFVWCK